MLIKFSTSKLNIFTDQQLFSKLYVFGKKSLKVFTTSIHSDKAKPRLFSLNVFMFAGTDRSALFRQFILPSLTSTT